MGRMFRIITEGSPEPSNRGEGESQPNPESGVPFVEVGGPEGVVSSEPRPTPRVLIPQSDATTAGTITLPPETISPIDPKPLSVSFHRFPKPGIRLTPSGVATDLVAYHFPDHPVTVEYRSVRDEIRKQLEEQGPRVVLFTAAAESAGTTTVILNFAVSLAREPGVKVLVVDANFHRPAMASRLGVAEAPGIVEVLRQTTPLAWAVQPSAIENLHVLASGSTAEGVTEAASEDFPKLLGQLRQWFDWVLIDVGVWPDTPVRESLGPVSDAVYLVTRQTDIQRAEFTNLRNSIPATGAILRGYITTKQ